MSPLATIFVAFLFSPESFDIRIALAGIIATTAMIVGYRHKHRIQLSANAIMLFFAVLFMAIENVLVGLLLQDQAMSPVVLFAIRTAIMYAIFSVYYQTNFSAFKKTEVIYIGLIATLSAAMVLLRFYGLRDSGIIFTSFILIFVPILVFLGSGFILHEKIRPKNVVTMGVVLMCVLYAILL